MLTLRSSVDDAVDLLAPLPADEFESSGAGQTSFTVVEPAPSNVVEKPRVELFVEVGDRVTYKVLGHATSESHTVQIIDIPSSLRMGLLNELTFLAQALMACARDEAMLTVGLSAAHHLRGLRVERL